jgi:hypothetical protein
MCDLLCLLSGIGDAFGALFGLLRQVFEFVLRGSTLGGNAFERLSQFFLARGDVFEILGNSGSASLDGV